MISLLFRRLKLVGSIVAFASIAPYVGEQAMAQAADYKVVSPETVTVTGTSIRGIGAIGSNIISLSPASIAEQAPQSLAQLLNALPSINSGGAPQGSNSVSYFAINIHGLGSSGSNSTLTLMDGRRLVGGGTNHSQIDPGMIPVIALQRLDVLTDGASSIYGSDAVAGVVNFVTRSRFEGVQLQAQAGVANNYNVYNAGVLMGEDWGKGWVELAGGLSYQSSLDNAARPVTAVSNYLPFGGRNNSSVNCTTATIRPNGTGNTYLSAFSTTQFDASNAANAPCDYAGQGNALPQEKRYNGLLKGAQTFGDVTVSGTLLVSVRRDNTIVSPTASTISATAFGSGPQANPFYILPPGVTATKETVNWNASAMIPNAKDETGSTSINATARADWNIDDNWLLSLTNTFGYDYSYETIQGDFCSSCALLALNGTTQNNASTTTSSVPGQNTISLNLPLNVANALDVWNPPATNRTSAAVIQSLASGTSIKTDLDNFDQLTLSADGELFSLPAGSVRLAAGLENYRAGLSQQITSLNNTGIASKGTQTSLYSFGRSVQAGYLEFAIPVISPSMNIPYMEKLDIDISGRHDAYSDVGHTTNPKYSATLLVTDGVKLTSSYSTSFVAPPLDTIGDPSQFYNSSQAAAIPYTSAFNLNTALFPGIAGVLPGCAVTATTCTIGSTSLPGIQAQRGGGKNLKPQTGASWSIGTDIAPDFLPGFEAVVTFWNNSLKGGVTSPSQGQEGSVASLANLLTVCPVANVGCSAAQVNALIANIPLTKGTLPSPVYFVANTTNGNILFLHLGGIDFNLQYQFDTDFGQFKIGDSGTVLLKADEHNAPGTPDYSVLNTVGANNSFATIQNRQRLNFGWSDGPYAASLFANYTAGYRDWGGGTVNGLTKDANGNPDGGGDIVKSLTTLDLHASYEIPGSFVAGTQIFIDVKNLLDADPPFIQGSDFHGNGYDRAVASPIGRITSIGISKIF